MPSLQKDYWVYILLCKNNSYYTGYTVDLQRRLKEHESRSYKSRFTRGFGANRLLCAWHIQGVQGDALRVESFIKKQSRKTKEIYIKDPQGLCKVILGQVSSDLTIEVWDINVLND